MKIPFFVLVMVLFSFIGHGVEIPFEPAFPSIERVVVPPGEQETCSDYVELPALPVKDGKTAVLKLNIRLCSKNLGGWNPWCAIEFNGHELNSTVANGRPRLLLRGPVLHTNLDGERRVPYWRKTSHSLLMAFFAPEDAVSMDPRIIDTEYGYDFYLDVDDVVNKRIIGADDRIENDAPNRFRFVNALTKRIAELDLVVKDIQLGYVPSSELLTLKGIRLWRTDGLKTVAGNVKGDGFVLNVSPYGGMELATGSDSRLYIESFFSYPDNPEMKFNRLALDSLSGKPGIKVNLTKQGASVVLRMETDDLILDRRIEPRGHYIRFFDTFSNPTKEDRGLIWRNEAAFSDKMPQWRLAGLSNVEMSNSLAASNPTIYMTDGMTAAGIIAEDTISRILIDMHLNANAIVMSNTGGGIAPGASLTVEWSIYPLTSPNLGYFDFINAVREDWHVNDTVPGPFLFSGRATPGMAPGVCCVGPWFEYFTGQDLSRDEYSAKVLPIMAELRKRFPGVILMPLMETNLVKFDAGTVPWGNELPLTYGDTKSPKRKYGVYISPELTAKLKAVTPLADSILCDKDGNAMLDSYYIYVNKPYINMIVQPAIGNSRFRQIMEQLDFLLDTLKFDGVYLDQFNQTSRDGIRYDKWDGCSVVLDKAGRVASKYYNYAIAGASARVEIIRRITSAGKLVLTNGHPITREEQSCGRLSFAEMENDHFSPFAFLDKKPPEFRYQALGHLTTPIILNLRPARYQKKPADGERDDRAVILNKGIITAIRNAQLPYYYGIEQPLSGPYAGSFEVSNWLFPFTPVRIDEGVMIGKERTITVISGTYKIGGKSRPKYAHFNRYGMPTNAENITVSGEPGAWTATVRLDDWNEIAAFEVVD